MFSETHRKKQLRKNGALAGNTQIEDSAVLRGELGMTGKLGLLLETPAPAGPSLSDLLVNLDVSACDRNVHGLPGCLLRVSYPRQSF